MTKYSKGGLPSETSLVKGEVYFSDELIRLVRAATVTENRCVATTPPDLKPLIFEGDIFVDNYEGLTKVLSMRLQKSGAQMLVKSRLEYKRLGAKFDAITWADQLFLVREKGRWVVADTGGTLNTKTLVTTLRNYISTACRP